MKALKLFSIGLILLFLSCAESVDVTLISQISILHKDHKHNIQIQHFLVDTNLYNINPLYDSNQNQRNILTESRWVSLKQEMYKLGVFEWSDQTAGWHNEPQHFIITYWIDGTSKRIQINNAAKNEFASIDKILKSYGPESQ